MQGKGLVSVQCQRGSGLFGAGHGHGWRGVWMCWPCAGGPAERLAQRGRGRELRAGELRGGVGPKKVRVGWVQAELKPGSVLLVTAGREHY